MKENKMDVELFTANWPVDSALPAPVVVRYIPYTQAIWRFPNGYGASVIDLSQYTGGATRIELVVLSFYGEGVDDSDLDFTTPVADDVVPWVESPGELIELLCDIRDLPRAPVATVVELEV